MRSSFLGLSCIAVSFFFFAAAQRLVKVFCTARISRRFSEWITVHYPRLISACLRTYCGFTVTFDRTHVAELPNCFLIISNHQSFFDIVVYMQFFCEHQIRFVAKQELGRGIPLVSIIMRDLGHCLLQRKGTPSQMMHTLASFAERCIKKGWNPVLFPEGTRSKTGKLGTFYAAGFRKLEDSLKIPVVTCALDGGWKISKLHAAPAAIKGGEIRVAITEIYPAPQNKAEQLYILKDSAQKITEQLNRWHLPAM